jgi:disulfide bond formation protein DsbB
MKLLILNSFNDARMNKALAWLFFTPLALIGFALYLQYYEGLAPCPLCTLQRGAYLLISIGAMFAFLLHKIKFLSVLSLLISFAGSIAGLLLSGRHVMLQYMDPSDVPSCGPDLAYMMEAFPLMETLKTVFTGSGSCADIDWSFLYLTIPEWAFLCFGFYFLLSALVISMRLKIKENIVLD